MITIASNPKNVAEIEHFVWRIAEAYKLRPDIIPNIMISLTEAVNNAIIHGNEADETKRVFINHARDGRFIRFEISDEGSGFNCEDIPDPTCEDNVEKCGGRGVLIMRNLSDRLIYTQNGRCVEIFFQL